MLGAELGNAFEKRLVEFVEKFKDLQEKEDYHKQKAMVVTTDFQAFLRENGLPDTFTMAEALHLAVRKSRD